MNAELITNVDRLVIDSREVAEMVGKQHFHLMRDIDTYIQYLGNPKSDYGLKSRVSEYFIEGWYVLEESGRSYKKYDCTKKGCEFIAHKLTGQKGAEFTARYIDRFHEMEKSIKTGEMSLDLIIALAQKMKSMEEKQLKQEDQLRLIRGKVDIVNNEEFTIMGYANIHNIRVNNEMAIHLGRKAARLARDKNYPIGNATHPVFGKVNTYHADILDIVFDEAGY